MNILIGKVQILDVPQEVAASESPVVWYSPEGFPNVQTDAVILDIDGELLLVTNGWRLKIIAITQVQRWMTGRALESNELLRQEQADYDEQI